MHEAAGYKVVYIKQKYLYIYKHIIFIFSLLVGGGYPQTMVIHGS